jgi:hypothetical protein
MSKKEEIVYNKKKIQVLSLNTGLSFIFWYKNYHISLLAIVTHEIFITIPLVENKSFIYRKTLNIICLVFVLKFKMNFCFCFTGLTLGQMKSKG